jgi:hypothetical protein
MLASTTAACTTWGNRDDEENERPNRWPSTAFCEAFMQVPFFLESAAGAQKQGEQPTQGAGCSRTWGSLRVGAVYEARGVPINVEGGV